MSFNGDVTAVGLDGESRVRGTVVLVEDTRLFSKVLNHRFSDELGLSVVHVSSLAALKELVEGGERFELAVVDLTLPDSSDGEVVDYTSDNGIPTVVFTGRFDRDIRNALLRRKVVDYVIKDSERAINSVVNTVKRFFNNQSNTILVVDDMSSVRSNLMELLKLQRYNVIGVGAGLEALEVLNRFPEVELMITDYVMPDMDGYELTQRVRRMFETDELGIIGISSSSDRLLSANFLKAGANDFIYRPFVEEELLCRVANSLDMLQQIRNLKRAAACDYLTGLFNRRYFFDRGPRQIGIGQRESIPCSIAILDIDHFKKLNDTYGHEIGDRVLIAVAHKLENLLDGSPHLLSRLGGEEFGILMTGLDSAAGTDYCDWLRHELSRVRIVADDEDLTITVSIGVSGIEGDETFDNHLNAADQFLYMAKHQGRNRVYSDALMAASVSAAE
jgi:diguanylate cyclase (GGDEF)-like protein